MAFAWLRMLVECLPGALTSDEIQIELVSAVLGSAFFDDGVLTALVDFVRGGACRFFPATSAAMLITRGVTVGGHGACVPGKLCCSLEYGTRQVVVMISSEGKFAKVIL